MPEIGWGATRGERKFGVPEMELGRRAVVAMDRESDAEHYGLLERYSEVVSKGYEARILEHDQRAVAVVAKFVGGRAA